MDHKQQDEARMVVVKKYIERAFEYLGLYAHSGSQYKRIEDQVKDYEGRVEKAQLRIEEIKKEPDANTKGSRDNVKAIVKDINDYKQRIASVETTMRKFHEECVKYQQEGVRCLELIEHFNQFKFKTPEEIEAEKHVKVEPENQNKPMPKPQEKKPD